MSKGVPLLHLVFALAFDRPLKAGSSRLRPLLSQPLPTPWWSVSSEWARNLTGCQFAPLPPLPTLGVNLSTFLFFFFLILSLRRLRRTVFSVFNLHLLYRNYCSIPSRSLRNRSYRQPSSSLSPVRLMSRNGLERSDESHGLATPLAPNSPLPT